MCTQARGHTSTSRAVRVGSAVRLEESAERPLAGSPPLSGFGFILPAPTGLGRPKCTDGHLAGTLGHGPVLTLSLPSPPLLCFGGFVDSAKAWWGPDREALWLHRWRSSRAGPACGRAARSILDQTRDEETLCPAALVLMPARREGLRVGEP